MDQALIQKLQKTEAAASGLPVGKIMYCCQVKRNLLR